jgi:hypothetical protein
MKTPRPSIPSESSEDAAHPFGGCNTLLGQYKTIGNALVEYQSEPHKGSVDTLRESLVFVPLEVLESYLEDLLNLEIPLEKLFIRDGRTNHLSIYVALIGMVVATGFGLFAASTGASLLLSFTITVCLAFPFAVLWHFAPREGVTRRLRFAQLLSRIVSDRRGGDSDEDGSTTRLLLSDLLARKSGTQGAAREVTSAVHRIDH